MTTSTTETTSTIETTSTTEATTTLSPCGYPPPLLNGEIVRITSSTSEYSCLSGFVMTGTKTILCSGTNWATSLPSCTVIDQSPDVRVFADWWQYFLAALLSFIALMLLALLIWCCCCSAHSAKIYPAGSDNIVCCGSCRKSTSHRTAHDDMHPSGLIDMEDNVYFVPVRHNYNTHINKKPPATVAIVDNSESTPRSDGRLRFMRVVQEVVEEDRKRKKAKPVNQWMPHTNPVRNINTSTK